MSQRRTFGDSVLLDSNSLFEASSPSSSGAPLNDILNTTLRAKRHIIIPACIGGLLAALAIALSSPRYLSSAVVLVERNQPNTVAVAEVYPSITPEREHLQNQVEFLRSNGVLRKVALENRLWDVEEFSVEPKGTLLDTLGFLSSAPAPITDDEKAQRIAEELGKRLSVDLIRQSSLIRVSLWTSQKELSAKLVNSLVAEYLESDTLARGQVADELSRWLQGKAAALKAEVQSAEAKLQAFRERESLTTIGGSAESVLVRSIQDTSERLAAAESRRAELVSALASVKNSSGVVAPIIQRDAQVEAATRIQVDAKRRLDELSAKYGSEHETMRQARADLISAERSTQRAVKEATVRARQTINESELAVRLLRQDLEQQKSDIRELNRKEFDLRQLLEDARTSRQLLDTFMIRAKEVAIAGNSMGAVARITDPAVPALEAFRPKPILWLGAGVGTGAVLGFAFTMMLAAMRPRVNTERDIREQLSQPVFSALPALNRSQRAMAPILQLERPQSPFAEAVRVARALILQSVGHDEVPVILITSAFPREGKTTFATNFCLSQAFHKRILLIDGDLRKPQIANHFFGNSKVSGLVDVLRGDISLSAAIQKVRSTSLHVMPAGERTDEAGELLQSPRFDEVVDLARKSFDIVVIDSPPVSIFGDALIISAKCSATILVVRAEQATGDEVEHTMDKLRLAGANVIGTVLNGTKERASSYYG